MIQLIRSIGINNIPVWVKVIVGITLAFALPLLVVAFAATQRVADLNAELNDRFITDVNEEQQEHLDDHINLAVISLGGITENTLYRNQLLTLIDEPTSGITKQTLTAQLQNLLQTVLVNNDLFENVRVINNRGRRVVSTDPEAELDVNVTDLDRGYEAGLTARLIGDRSNLAVYLDENEVPQIDVVYLITNLEGEVDGYLVGTLNTDNVIYQNMESHDFMPSYSYLISRNGIIFVEEENRNLALLSSQIAPHSNAISGQSGEAIYEINGERTYGHYTPVAGNEFALVTETIGDVTLFVNVSTFLVRNSTAIVVVGVILTIVSIILINTIVAPIRVLKDAIGSLIYNDINTEIPEIRTNDQIGQLHLSIVDFREHMLKLIADQETRITNRTRDIRATQEVSRYAATQRDIETLMNEVVALIVEQFPNIYHAQIFMVDQYNNFAMLKASTGEPGRQLLARGHRLEVGGVSVIGQVTDEGRTIVASDTVASDVHRVNQFLPDTRSELAIPLAIGDRIIGALDVQSKESNAFSADDVQILQVMADQIAVSLDNAQLYQDSLQRLQEIERNNRLSTLNAWRDYLKDQRAAFIQMSTGYDTSTNNTDYRQQAIITGQTVVGVTTDTNTIPLAVPVKLRGYTLGAVLWELPAGEFNNDSIQLAEELVNRLAVTLDNARLFQQSQQTAGRERIVNDIAAKLSGKIAVDEILKTAIREVGQALRSPEVNIELNLSKPQSNGQHQDTDILFEESNPENVQESSD